MADSRGGNFPKASISYDIGRELWVMYGDDGSITTWLTDIVQHIAGNLLYIRPKKFGDDIAKGRRAAIIESGKYVGPINAPLSGKIIEVNPKILDSAGIVNDDPYGEGWILRIKPSDLEGERSTLLEGGDARAASSDKLERESGDCFSNQGE